MTAQAIPAPAKARQTTFPGRLRAPAELLTTPGFLPLILSNALSQSFAMRMQGIAVAWVVLEMTDSRLLLGVVNGLPALSIILFSLLGGLLADSRDLRRVLIATRSGLSALAFLAALLVATGQIRIEYLMVYVLVAVGLSAIEMPVGRTLTLRTVGATRLLSANAMQTLAMNLVNIAAPASIAVLAGVAGVGAAFAVLGAGYTLGLVLPTRAQLGESGVERRHSRPIADLIDGLTYVRAASGVRALVALGFLMPFAGVYFAMVPVFARDVLDAGAGGLALLAGSFSVGSLCGAAMLVTSAEIRGRGRKVALVSVLFGAAMIAFALSHSLILSCAISLAMGMMGAFWQNTLTTMVQTVAAPEMQGRALSVFTMGFQLASAGWLIGGVLASLVGAETALIVAGLIFAGLSTLVFMRSTQAREID